MAKGLSMRINESQGNTLFEVQGPMGKGLQINSSGLHIAFTSGTGCLVFVDLVAHLIRKNIGALDSDEATQLSSSFKFVFFVSFPTREDAIALDLC